MYKTIFFIHKSDDKETREIIINNVIPSFSKIFNQEILLGKIESNLLNDLKFEFCFEVTAGSKDEFDKLMNSEEGKKINKELAGIFKNITVYPVNF
jgi:hypothetical protein